MDDVKMQEIAGQAIIGIIIKMILWKYHYLQYKNAVIFSLCFFI